MQKVLIVDDSKVSRRINRDLLSKLGYEVISEAVDGVDGLAKYEEHKPEFILTDVEMPNLDGVGMVKKIRELGHDVHVVVITSVVNSQVTQEVIKYGVKILKKPLKEAHLHHALLSFK
ncbi:MAG: response regulator [Campylobacterota bacterium]|nr:response regulator [Campylobacterota bacterium]